MSHQGLKRRSSSISNNHNQETQAKRRKPSPRRTPSSAMERNQPNNSKSFFQKIGSLIPPIPYFSKSTPTRLPPSLPRTFNGKSTPLRMTNGHDTNQSVFEPRKGGILDQLEEYDRNKAASSSSSRRMEAADVQRSDADEDGLTSDHPINLADEDDEEDTTEKNRHHSQTIKLVTSSSTAPEVELPIPKKSGFPSADRSDHLFPSNPFSQTASTSSSNIYPELPTFGKKIDQSTLAYLPTPANSQEKVEDPGNPSSLIQPEPLKQSTSFRAPTFANTLPDIQQTTPPNSQDLPQTQAYQNEEAEAASTSQLRYHFKATSVPTSLQQPTPPGSQENLVGVQNTVSQAQFREEEQTPSSVKIYSSGSTPIFNRTSYHKVTEPPQQTFRHFKTEPVRPNVTGHTPHKGQQKKGWEARSISPSNSSVSSRGSNRSSRRRKMKSNMRSPQTLAKLQKSQIRNIILSLEQDESATKGPRAAQAMRNVKNLFLGKGTLPVNSIEKLQWHLSHAGFNDKDTYQKLLQVQQRQTPTFDDKIAPNKIVYDVTRKHKQSKAAQTKASEPLIFDLNRVRENLQQIQDEEERKEQEIAEKLKKPKVPSQLSVEQEAKVDQCFNNSSFKSTVSTAQCESKSLRRLKDRTWLDDEIMNFYVAMMGERAKSCGKKIHPFNSFFYQRLSETGYSAVKRWTKKTDLFANDVVIFPINIGNMHWTAGAINFEKKRIEYYDSMGDYGRHRASVFKIVREYLNSEHKERKGKPFDFEGWTNEFNDNTPQQDNGSDCGVFSCQTLEMITRGRDLKDNSFEFDSTNMPFFRRLMVWEIANAKLEKRTWGSPQI